MAQPITIVLRLCTMHRLSTEPPTTALIVAIVNLL